MSIPRPAFGPLAAVLVTALLAFGFLAAVLVTAPLAFAATGGLTRAELAADLIAGVNTRAVPANLEPPLTFAARSEPIIAANGCHLGFSQLKSKPCVYGDKKSRTTVVLFGDSHAATWFPALDLISHQHHWRLVILTKAGCPPAEVTIASWWQHGAPYTECNRWRNTAKAQIAVLRPALLIMTWARFLEAPEAWPRAGVPTGHGSVYLDGTAAIFSFARRVSRHVIFISDVPTLTHFAPSCVAAHPSDVRACTPSLSAATRLPDVKARELSLAAEEGVYSIDPTPWFCAPTACPVIVGNIILYRDASHVVPAWSRFIAPVLADAILPVVQGERNG